jgi:hypothetical protein
VTYNLDLEVRIDRLADHYSPIVKKKMFGGVGYMSAGNMCFGIHKEFLIIRATGAKEQELLKNEDIRPFDMSSRPMKGWLMVSPDAVETEEQLVEMLDLSFNYVKTLPPKEK